MSAQLDIAFSSAEDGMRRSADHANEEVEGWTDLAYFFLRNFCMTHQFFISEDVSDASKVYGLVQPPTDRAWGSVYRRAQKDGMIVQDGSGRSRRRHASICPRWRSLLFRRAA